MSAGSVWTLEDVRALCRGLGWSPSRVNQKLGIEAWGDDEFGLWITPAASPSGLRIICTARQEDRTLYEPESVVAWLLST